MKKNIKILYVEDETEIRENTKRPLQYLCNELFIATNGQEGLELYNKCQPDIVVSDIKMPIMNGIDMCKSIKKIDPNQHIIFTTAHSESGYFMEAIEMQVDGYILKPIDYDLLEKKIENITNQINIEYSLQQQKILTKEITKLQDNLLVVLDSDQNMIFSNDIFLEFFHIDKLSQFKEKHNRLAYLFLENEDFFIPNGVGDQDWIKDIQKLENSKRIVSMMNIDLFTPQAFLVSIKNVKDTFHTIIIFTEITNIAIEKKEYKQKAFTDELTNIYNRAYFNEELSRQILTYKRKKILFCFIILDIDKFKDFNDTYGHQVGDDILISLSKLINKYTRVTDTFARWGGEEFVKILPNTNIDEAMRVAEFLRDKIENHIFNDGLKVTCSFGVSQFMQNDNQETLMKRADDALYKAKENGRNRVEIEENIKYDK